MKDNNKEYDTLTEYVEQEFGVETEYEVGDTVINSDDTYFIEDLVYSTVHGKWLYYVEKNYEEKMLLTIDSVDNC
jgi:hypothetical protein